MPFPLGTLVLGNYNFFRGRKNKKNSISTNKLLKVQQEVWWKGKFFISFLTEVAKATGYLVVSVYKDLYMYL